MKGDRTGAGITGNQHRRRAWMSATTLKWGSEPKRPAPHGQCSREGSRRCTCARENEKIVFLDTATDQPRGERAARPLAEGGRTSFLTTRRRYAQAGKRGENLHFSCWGEKIQNAKLFYWSPSINKLKALECEIGNHKSERTLPLESGAFMAC